MHRRLNQRLLSHDRRPKADRRLSPMFVEALLNKSPCFGMQLFAIERQRQSRMTDWSEFSIAFDSSWAGAKLAFSDQVRGKGPPVPDPASHFFVFCGSGEEVRQARLPVLTLHDQYPSCRQPPAFQPAAVEG